MMGRLRFSVEQPFPIRGRGVVLLPGIMPVGEKRFRVGDPLRLVRPDGSEFQATIAGLDLGLGHPKPTGDVPVIVGGLGKTDVSVGTEVWSIG